jgi:hypothetical protein
MSIERMHAGANSATYLIKVDSVPLALSLTEWEQLPAGKLRDLLTQAFTGPLGDNETFIRAFAAAGGEVSAVVAGLAIGVPLNWSVGGVTHEAALGIPDQALPGDTTVWAELGSNSVAVKVSVSYSASE